jgi:hypothetical protein
MKRVAALFLTIVLGSLAADDPVVFKSDVAMTRVDAQVVDLTGRSIPGLRAGDFVLRVDGKPQPIRNFATESMPIDVLLLLDVSGSMQPHIQRIADASESALRVLAPADRIAIMVFDTHTRVRLSFRSDHGGVSEELHSLIRSERFDGGTHITHALLDAAHYLQREGRPNARRAIVILTDDETQDAQDEPQVEQALDEANAVLSFLRAPYDEQSVQGRRVPSSSGPWGGSGPIGGGGTWGGGGGASWPGGSTWPGRGSRLPGGVRVGGMDSSHSAGTADIAKDSGGDVMEVDSASAFQETLEKLRQRYALYFYWPPGPANPEERLVTLALSASAGAEFREAEVRYRRAYLGKAGGRRSGTLMEVSREPDSADPPSKSASAADRGLEMDATSSVSSTRERRPAVNEDSNLGPNATLDNSAGDSQAAEAQPAPVKQNSAKTDPSLASPLPRRRGWPSVGESPQQQ